MSTKFRWRPFFPGTLWVTFWLTLLVLASVAFPSIWPESSVLAATPARRPAAGKLLYRWTLPRKKQVGAWSNQRGVLSYDGEGVQRLFPHYVLKHVTNFAVQARMRADGAPGLAATLTGFGLIVGQNPSDPHTAVSAGSFFSQNPEDNNPELVWNGDTVGAAAFDPKTSWRLYRLEVQGDQYTLSIDGKPMVAYTINDYPHPSYAGIFSTFYKVSAKDFRVYAIGPATTNVTAAPIAKQLNLTVTDLPDDGFYIPDLQHWYTNEEVARERGVALSDITASGRIVTYGIDIYPRGPDVETLYSSVTVFATAADARADMASHATTLEAQFSGNPDYQVLPDPAVGEASAAFSYQQNPLGSPATFITYYFVRGRYACIMDFAFDASLPASQNEAFALNLARIIDGRMKQNP